MNIFKWLFDGSRGPRGQLIPRWIFLRALALIYFSAFYSLLFQIKGLIGPQGILPAREILAEVAQQFGWQRYWFAPSLFWISSGSAMMMAVVWIGLIASLVALFNLWPRLSFFVCFVCFLSFVSASGDFSSYQSDGMLLEAGFLALFFAPRGLWPGWGADSPPSRMSWFLLQWEWFRIYFESGMVKLASGDVEWRNFTAMDEYYQNGPLPTWIGWHVEHLPHWFHAATVGGTLALELVLVFMMFFSRRVRLILFFIVTPWEIGVILTANYAFLNYLVLSLGFLLLDDKFLLRFAPTRWRPHEPDRAEEATPEQSLSLLAVGDANLTTADIEPTHSSPRWRGFIGRLGFAREVAGLAIAALMLTWIAYNTTVQMIGIPLGKNVGPMKPLIALEPFRIANQYGLFAVMTRGRYEIEFQRSEDGTNWTPYPFQYKPQALNEAPGIYAPYQPRFDWNLWFASLGDWRDNEIVPLTEERLLVGDRDVLTLFRSDPFAENPPRYVRAVLWQYWFTTEAQKRSSGDWWRREYLGLYAPELTVAADGRFAVVAWPEALPPHD
ncbi:MAG TPA: lipase maturation factor family protein [Terracidiphilus sp.]|nr:lipase maturation factor family protein [Terracidiphilus sp.]